MDLGFHVYVEGGCRKFLEKLNDVGVKVVKLHISPNTKRKDVREACKILYDNKMKAYVSLFSIKQTPIQKDSLYPYITFNREGLYDRYIDVMKWLVPKTPIIGVGLIEHLEMAIKDIPGSTHGLTRKDVKIIQNEISGLIGNSFPRILNCRVDDVEAGHWDGVDFDVYDFCGEWSSDWDTRIKALRPKAAWVSEVRVQGGFLTEVQQIKMVNLMKAMASRYPYVFIYSRDVKGFRWGDILHKLPIKG